MSLSPFTATVMLGATQQFTATVSNTSNTAVSWEVNGIAGGNTTVGTISLNGLYTAPENLLAQPSVSVQATSQADTSKHATATVTVLSDVAVSVAPATAEVELGATRQFTSSVTGSGNPNRAVNWTVAGPGCAAAACGTIDPSGLFIAPPVRPAPPDVSVTAQSAADSSKSAGAAVNLTSSFTVAVSGPAAVNAGSSVQFTAALLPAPNSNPSRDLSWSVSGPGCSGGGCGSISGTGMYTAPASAPAPNSVNITATPAADPVKAASIAVTINGSMSVAVSPPSATVELGRSQIFAATVSGAQDPSVTWDVNGVVGGDQSVGTVTNSAGNPNTTTYTAPLNRPTPNQVTVRARSNANPSVSATAAVTLFSTIAVQVTPAAATRAVNHRQTFTVQVTGTSNANVEWRVNGIPGGDSIAGRICAAGVDPCQPVSITSGGSVDYLAPAIVPPANPVALSATSQADPARSGNALVTILAHIQVSVSPPSVTLAPRAAQQFAATVDGTSNQDVTWQVSGPACGAAGSPCGVIDSAGFYTAPFASPSPNTLAVTATSAEDTSRSGSAAVTISTGPSVLALLPASATVGAAGGFPWKVLGSNFVSSSPGPGSAILLGGSARATACATSNECATTLAATDLATAGNLPVQIRNPDSSTSNQVSFVVVGAASGDDVIPLTSTAPSVSGKDIAVVEPSTAGTSAGINLDILALGLFANPTCNLQGTPLALTRPSSGTATAEICAFSLAGLDPALAYTLTGPTPNDVRIIAKEPLGLGIIHLTLAITSTAQTGPRSLFAENPNKDKTAASGALEVK